jgi:hypothetical protein
LDFVHAVPRRAPVAPWLPRAQRLDLGQREVVREPALDLGAVDRLPRPAVRELQGDVGGGADLRLVPGDQRAVPGHHEVGLDAVGAHLDGELVGAQRVLGPVARRAAVRDHERPALRQDGLGRGGGGG